MQEGFVRGARVWYKVKAARAGQRLGESPRSTAKYSTGLGPALAQGEGCLLHAPQRGSFAAEAAGHKV